MNLVRVLAAFVLMFLAGPLAAQEKPQVPHVSAGTIAFPWGRPAALGRVGRAGRALRRYPIAYLGVAIVVPSSSVRVVLMHQDIRSLMS